MPIKKDGQGKRWVEMELVTSGTPEQVWRALATGPGNTAWFVKTEIIEKVGGTLTFDFGHGATSSGEVTVWEPPNRFAYVERDWQAGAPHVATEITITSRSGGRCVVRMVHSLFTSSDDWDDQVEGFEQGWPGFFAVLRVYLEHFAGDEAASFVATLSASTDPLTTWLRLGDALDLRGASVGEPRSSSVPEAWSGVVEHVHQDRKQRWLLLRLERPAPGLVLVGTSERGGATTVSVCRYFYGDSADNQAAESEPCWRDWLASTFGDAAPPNAKH